MRLERKFEDPLNLKIHLKDGTEIAFNVFSATLAYSREHIFIYSTSKTTEDFIRCIITVFRKLGGISEEVLTDNMASIVTLHNGEKKVKKQISQLFKDLGCELKLCKVRTPQTKGKVENSNKYINWIYAYDYQLNSEEELIKLIEENIVSDSNRQINQGTLMPPYKLFKKEKEYLKPLPSHILLESYIKEHYRQVVPSTMLINYKGNRYSLPPAYIGKAIDIYPTGDSIYIYHNNTLVTKHTISQNRVNYHKNHYEQGLNTAIKNKEIDIEAIASENLKRLDKLGKK